MLNKLTIKIDIIWILCKRTRIRRHILKSSEKKKAHMGKSLRFRALVIYFTNVVVVAERMAGSKMYELVKVGYDKLVG